MAYQLGNSMAKNTFHAGSPSAAYGGALREYLYVTGLAPVLALVFLSGCGTVLPIAGVTNTAFFPSGVHAAVNSGVTIPCATGCHFTNYTMANGLPSNVITSVFVLGPVIYVGTSAGVAYSTSPSTTWTVLNHASNNLANDSVTALYVVADSPSNDLYVGTPSGLSIALAANGSSLFANNTGFTVTGCGTSSVVNSVLVGSVVYVGTNGQVFSASLGTPPLSFSAASVPGCFNNYKLSFDASQNVYAVENSTFIYRAPAGTSSFSCTGSSPISIDSFFAYTNLYLGFGFPYYGGALSANSGTTLSFFPISSSSAVSSMAAVEAGSQITLYAATTGDGVFISTNGGAQFSHYTTSSGLGSNTVNAVITQGTTVYAATNSGLSIGQ